MMTGKDSSLSKRQVPPRLHDEDPILTMSEASRRFGKAPATVARWIRDGLLEAIRLPSGLYGIRQSQVEKFLGVVYYKKLES